MRSSVEELQYSLLLLLCLFRCSISVPGSDVKFEDDQDRMLEGEIESRFALAAAERPMRGTHRQMRDYFRERLMAALSRLPMVTTQSSTSEVQHANSELQKLLFGLLSHENNFQNVAPEAAVLNQVEITSSSFRLQEFSPQLEANQNTQNSFVSSPFYTEALEAWNSLTQVQSHICADLRNSQSTSITNVPIQEEIIDFPSLSSIDSLCSLLVQAVSLGAEIGFDAVTRNVLTENSTDNSFISSDQSDESRS